MAAPISSTPSARCLLRKSVTVLIILPIWGDNWIQAKLIHLFEFSSPGTTPIIKRSYLSAWSLTVNPKKGREKKVKRSRDLASDLTIFVRKYCGIAHNLYPKVALDVKAVNYFNIWKRNPSCSKYVRKLCHTKILWLYVQTKCLLSTIVIIYVDILIAFFMFMLWELRILCVNFLCLFVSLQIFPKVLPQVQPELFEKCRESQRYAEISGRKHTQSTPLTHWRLVPTILGLGLSETCVIGKWNLHKTGWLWTN